MLFFNRKEKTIYCVLYVLLVASLIAVYLPVLRGLVILWSTSEDQSHGFFIIPISLYIIWLKKDKLSHAAIVPSSWGIVWVLFAVGIYLLASFADISSVAAYSLLPLVIGIVIYLFGFMILYQCLFPIALLLFMMPIPSQIYVSLTNPLQIIVSTCSVWLVSLVDIPICRSGNVIQLPDRTLQVVAACSGLRSLMMIIALTSIFGYMTLRKNVLRVILVVSSIPIAIIVNIIRVVVMIIAFHYFNFDLTTGKIHTVFGLVIFMFAILIVAMVKGALLFWDK